MNFKDIHIGSYIENKVKEDNISIDRIISFLKIEESEIFQMYTDKDLPTDILLKWSKLLKYDFFRIYSHHLILYSPPKGIQYIKKSSRNTVILPEFKKNIYTKELIEFIIEQMENGEKTKEDIINSYKIPKTTLYKWIKKHSKDLVSNFKELVNKEMNKKHNVEYFSEKLNVSVNTLQRAFVKVNRSTAKEYIENRIIFEAKFLLIKSEMNIGEISYTLGFKNLSHFSKFFKSKTGISPIFFRRGMD